MVEEVDDLHQGFLGLVLARHVGEGDAGGLFHIDLGVGLAHAAQAPHAAHSAHEEDQQAHHQQHGQDIAHEDVHQVGGLLLDHRAVLHPVLVQQGSDILGLQGDGGGDIPGGPALAHLLGHDLRQVLAAVDQGLGHILLEVEGVLVGGQLHGGHPVLLDHLDEGGIGDLLRAPLFDLPGHEVEEEDQHQGPEDGPDEEGAPAGVLAAPVVLVFVGVQWGRLLLRSARDRGIQVSF